MSTTTPTTAALKQRASVIAGLRNASERQAKLARDLRDHSYELERASGEATKQADAAVTELHMLLTALAAPGASIEAPPARGSYANGDEVARFVTAFGEAFVRVKPTNGKANGPKKATAGAFPRFATGYLDLFEPKAGTSDPAKQADQVQQATEAAMKWIESRTARAILDAYGLEPDTDPLTLITADRTGNRGGWTIWLGDTVIGDLSTRDFYEARGQGNEWWTRDDDLEAFNDEAAALWLAGFVKVSRA